MYLSATVAVLGVWSCGVGHVGTECVQHDSVVIKQLNAQNVFLRDRS